MTAEYNEMQRKEKQVCRKTINKCLKAKRWNKRVAAKVPLIKRENRKKRVDFCKKMSSGLVCKAMEKFQY